MGSRAAGDVRALLGIGGKVVPQAQPTVPPRRESPIPWRFGPYLIFLGLGLGLAFYPTLLSNFEMMPGDAGDTRLVSYILECSYRWLMGWLTFHPVNLWDPPFYFPSKNVGAYSEILLGSAPVYWLLRCLRLSPETSLQLWMMVVLTLNFASMTFFLRNCLGFEGFASALGGFLFAFGGPRLVQMGHQQLLPQFFTPLALYGLFRAFEPRRMTPKQGTYLFFVCLAAQFWAGYYLGWFLFFGVFLLGLGALCLPVHRKSLFQHLADNQRAITGAGCLALLLITPMAYHYLRAIREVGPREFWDTAQMIPRLQSWFYLGGGSWLYAWQQQFGFFRPASMENEQYLGIGWITVSLAIVGFWRFQRSRGGWAPLTGLCAIAAILLITRYPGGLMPWKYLTGVIPGASVVRAVSRIVLLMLIPFSIGLAYFAQTISRSAALLVAAICFFEQGQGLSVYDKFEQRRDVNALAAKVNKECGAFYYSPSYELNRSQAPEQYKFQIDAMLASLLTGVPTINGYAGSSPAEWDDLWDNRIFDEAGRLRIRRALEHWTTQHHLDPAKVCWIQSVEGNSR
jgi:hypothetical protein